MARPPIPRPPFGIHTRVEVLRVLDGDTVEVRGELLASPFRVRIIGINAPEVHARNEEERERARKAKEFLEKLLIGRAGVSLLILLPDREGYDLVRTLLSFDRLEGHLYLDRETLVADELVLEGLAEPVRWK